MIKTFRDKVTESLFARQFSKKFSAELLTLAWRKLAVLEVAESLGDLRVLPENRLEMLTGKRPGQYGIHIKDQWRICFQWRAGNAYEVEITDHY